MGGGDQDGWAAAPSGGPMRDDHWTHFDNSVNAVSFGFVATAILVSMFLVMAIFEKLLRTTSPEISPARTDIEAGNRFNAKLFGYPSPKVKAREVSVVMPGEKVPTFIANPAPVHCAPERMPWPSHQHTSHAPT